MLFRALGDVVVVLHFAFIVFVAVGGFLAWRWRWLMPLHLAAVAWGIAIVVIGFDCPLTPLEKALRERGGQAPYEGGFVDRYIENVVYPDELTPYLRALATIMVLAAYLRPRKARNRSRGGAHVETGRSGP